MGTLPGFYDDVLTPGLPECDHAWRRGFEMDPCVKVVIIVDLNSVGWCLPSIRTWTHIEGITHESTGKRWPSPSQKERFQKSQLR